MPIATQELELDVAAPRLWAALKDSSVLLPKIAPQLFSSIEHVEGNPGEVGSVRIMKYGSVLPEGAFSKEKVVALDHSAMITSTEEIEGPHISHGFTKWRSTLKFIPIDESNTKLEASFDFEGGDETAVAHSKEGFVTVFTGLAEYVKSSGADA